MQLPRRTFASALVALAGAGLLGGRAWSLVAPQPGDPDYGQLDLATAIPDFEAGPVRFIATQGYSSFGIGSSGWVADAIAGPDLARQFPRYCLRSADGLFFRVAPNDAGFLSAAVSGAVATPTRDDSNNHQPALAELLAYAETIRARGIGFSAGHYSIWTPRRAASNDNTWLDQSGLPFVINRAVEFKAGNGGTQFNRRKFDGSDPARFAGTQVLPDCWVPGNKLVPGPIYWRGGMFFLNGAAEMPSRYEDRPGLTLSGRWIVDGGIARSQSPGLYSKGLSIYGINPVDGSGWDVRDKCVWASQDRFTGDIVFRGDVTLRGFRGEVVYQGGRGSGSIYQSGILRIADTDGDGFNPSVWWSSKGRIGTVQIESIEIDRAFQALEGATGWGGHIGSLVIRDCGRANGLWAGIHRGKDIGIAEPAVLSIDSVKVVRSDHFTALTGNKIGSASFIDSYLWISSDRTDARNVDIAEVTVTADRNNIPVAILFAGSERPFGTHDNHVGRLVCGQTALGAATGKSVINPVTWVNGIGDNCWVDAISGVSATSPQVGRVAGPGFAPGFRQVTLAGWRSAGKAAQDIGLVPRLAGYYGPSVACFTTGTEGSFPVFLPDVRDAVPGGTRYEIANANDGKRNTALIVLQVENSGLNRPLAIPAGTSATFAWDGRKWQPLALPDPNRPTPSARMLRGLGRG